MNSRARVRLAIINTTTSAEFLCGSERLPFAAPW